MPSEEKNEPKPDEQPSDQEKPKENKKKDGKGLGRTAIILAVIFGILLVIGVVPRLLSRPQLNKDAKAQKNTVPQVNVVPVKAPPPFDEVNLPGNIQAVQQTAVVARASGYLKRWFVDIGDQVRAGQTLALIEAPDVDAQVAQARAQLSSSQASLSQTRSNVSNLQANVAQVYANLSRSEATLQQAKTDLSRSRAALAQAEESSAQQRAQLVQAQASLSLARVTAQRYQRLLADGAIDQQTTDQAVAAQKTNEANVDALQAALRASQANVDAFRAAVESSKANVKAYADGVSSSRASVNAAQASVQSGRANVEAAAANVESNRSNLTRNAVFQAFQKVTAPFSGIITARNVDTGAFISASGAPASGGGNSTNVGTGDAGTTSQGNAAGGSALSGGSSPGGSGGGQSSSLFSIAQLDTLRVYINIPQSYVGNIRAGQTAAVNVREAPGQTFQSKIVRTAGALDPTSRTLVAEVRLNNPGGKLRPGMFADVHVKFPHPPGSLIVPDSALVTSAQGTQLIVVQPNNKIHFQTITIGRDFGKTLEVTSGVQAGQQIVSNPTDGLLEGETVKPQQDKTQDQKSSS